MGRERSKLCFDFFEINLHTGPSSSSASATATVTDKCHGDATAGLGMTYDR